MDKKEKQKGTTKQTATKTRNKPIIILKILGSFTLCYIVFQ